jgi:ATP:ADP antiporter, AAA family
VSESAYPPTMQGGKGAASAGSTGDRVLLAGALFFLLLGAYYLIRPLRDQASILIGTEQLKYMYTGTFLLTLCIVPTYGWVLSRFSRQKALPIVYAVCAALCFGFYALLHYFPHVGGTAYALFWFISIINLFIVSVFWSLMTDVFSTEESTRWFSRVALGGTLGGLAGPFVASTLSKYASSPDHLLWVAGLGLLLAIPLVRRLYNSAEVRAPSATRELLGKDVLAGAKLVFRSRNLLLIAAALFIYLQLSGLLYFLQVQAVEIENATRAAQTAAFAQRDLVVNIVTVGLQLTGFKWFVDRFGARWLALLVPMVVAIPILGFALAPSLLMLTVLAALHRAADFAVLKPLRDMCFTVLDSESRYKAKNFIDTSIYRFGDLVGGWLSDFLVPKGLPVVVGAFVSLCGLWAVAGFAFGRSFDQARQAATSAVKQG